MHLPPSDGKSCDMSRPDIKTELFTAFQPYLRSSDELYDIRLEIAKHVAQCTNPDNLDVNQQRSSSIPTHITGFRRKYIQALNANFKAKQQHTQLNDELELGANQENGSNTSTQTLQTHIEVLRLRKQYEKYQIISSYESEIENLAAQHHIYDTLPIASSASAQTYKPLADIQSNLELRAQEFRRKLEVAVLQANYDLKREKQLLEDARSSELDMHDLSSAAKLHALVATQAELTNWIEESLAQCDVEDTDSHSVPVDDSSNHSETSNYREAINEQYEKYLAARERLLEAVLNLSTPRSTASQARPAVERSSSLTMKVVSATQQSTTPISTLPFVESQHIPLLSQRIALDQLQTHIDDILLQHSHVTADQLLRLSDESHLLPSYPILAKSKKPDEHLDPTERLLHAWKFATDAAGTSASATVEKQIRLGEAAVDEVNIVLDEQKRLDEMWARAEAT